MKKYNWETAFPDTTTEFHDKLEQVLLNLPEETEADNKMEQNQKRISVKKIVLVAAAATLVLGMTTFAAGKLGSIEGHSSSIPTYKEMPTEKELQAELGAVPHTVERFANGYTFVAGYPGENTACDEEGNVLETYTDLSFQYKNGGELVALFMDASKSGGDMMSGMDLAETYQDTGIYYCSYANKMVPGEYQMTEQDKKDQEDGTYVFSFGAADISVHTVQGAAWTQDGVHYSFTVSDSSLTKQNLMDMAKEIIDAK